MAVLSLVSAYAFCLLTACFLSPLLFGLFYDRLFSSSTVNSSLLLSTSSSMNMQIIVIHMGVSDGVCRGFITSRQLATNAAYFIRIYFLSPPRGYIRSQQPAKIAAYFVRIYLLLLPTLSVFSLKLLKKFISLPRTLVSSDNYFKTY